MTPFTKKKKKKSSIISIITQGFPENIGVKTNVHAKVQLESNQTIPW